ncbi:Uncharacterised protein [Chromobacterium violaceum]|uniref:N-acetyltransferase domain-containing protein n=1 Tax=Chromobacterium violaceum TaxID=536 RepID=A0A3S4HUC9_CHRVL|nr:Uncharacterised protein [Chromobacterium violaceum]
MLRIQTERLLLRAVNAGDAEALYAIFGDPETNRYNPHGPSPRWNMPACSWPAG